MAGRRTSRAARLAAVGVTVAVTGAVVPSAAGPSGAGPIVASQTDMNASIPFGWRTDTGKAQKIAQTFVAPKEAHKLASVSLVLAGTKSNAVLKVFEVGKKPPFGTLLRKLEVPVDYHWGDPGSRWITARVRPALVVEPGARYSFALKSERPRRTMASAGGMNEYRGGQWWCFCPTWTNGGADYDNVRWQSGKELDSPTMDVTFKLGFWRKG